MKTIKCAGCGKEIEVFDNYQEEYCCNGIGCCCMGKPINPLFCGSCEKKIFGKREGKNEENM